MLTYFEVQKVYNNTAVKLKENRSDDYLLYNNPHSEATVSPDFKLAQQWQKGWYIIVPPLWKKGDPSDSMGSITLKSQHSFIIIP